MKMKAAILHEQGREHPFTQSKALSVEEVELDPPGEGEVLIKTGAAGLCHSDLSMINGTMQRKLPMVPGHEAAGVVEEIGKNVTQCKVGDHVVMSFVPICGKCEFCTTGRLIHLSGLIVIVNAGRMADVVGDHYRRVHRLEVQNHDPWLHPRVHLVHVSASNLVLLPRALVGVGYSDPAPVG